MCWLVTKLKWRSNQGCMIKKNKKMKQGEKNIFCIKVYYDMK